MSIGVILVLIVVYAQLRFIFRDKAVLSFDEPQDVQVIFYKILYYWKRIDLSTHEIYFSRNSDTR